MYFNALHRFICRRGSIKSIGSDQGTNFIGAQKVLEESVKLLDNNKIQKTSQKRNGLDIHPSHRSSPWWTVGEVNNIGQNNSLLCSKRTNFGWWNSTNSLVWGQGNHEWLGQSQRWQITKMTLSTLTPNHLLLLRTNPVIPPGLFQREDLYSWKRWRQVPCRPVFWDDGPGNTFHLCEKAQIEYNQKEFPPLETLMSLLMTMHQGTLGF